MLDGLYLKERTDDAASGTYSSHRRGGFSLQLYIIVMLYVVADATAICGWPSYLWLQIRPADVRNIAFIYVSTTRLPRKLLFLVNG